MKETRARSRPRAGRLSAILVAGVLLALLVGVVGAQSSGSYDLSWYAFNNGGGLVGSSQHALVGSLGEMLADSTRSDNFEMDGGFMLSRGPFQTYLPLVIRFRL